MKRKQHFVAIVGYFSFAAFLVALLSSTEQSYHLNVYSVVPVWGWTSFIVSLLSGTLLTYHAARTRSRRIAIHGFAIVACSFGVFWFLGRFIGLRFWSATRGDILGHLARAEAIASAGTVPTGDIYPPLHVLIAILRIITGLPVATFGLLSIVTYPLLVGGIVLCVRRMVSSRVASYVAVATLPIFYVKYAHNLFPWVTFFALIPCLILLLEVLRATRTATQRRWVTGGAILLLVAISLGHPMSGGVAFFVVGILVSSRRIGTWWSHEPSPSEIRIALLLPALVAYPAWYLSQISFQRFFTVIVVSLLTTAPSSATQKLGRSGASGYTLTQLITQYLVIKWGVALLLLSTAGLVALVIGYRVLHRRASTNEIVILTLFVSGGVLGAFLLVGNFIANNIYRINQVTIAVGIVLLGVGLWWTSECAVGRMRLLRYALLIVVLVGIVTTPFMIYSSSHLVETEFEGMSYYIQTVDQSDTLYQDDISVVFISYLLQTTNTEPTGIRQSLSPLPKHLGYPNNATFAESVRSDQFYAVTKTRDMEWIKTQPPNRRPYVRYYTATDASRLVSDKSVSRIYANGNFSIWTDVSSNN